MSSCTFCQVGTFVIHGTATTFGMHRKADCPGNDLCSRFARTVLGHMTNAFSRGAFEMECLMTRYSVVFLREMGCGPRRV